MPAHGFDAEIPLALTEDVRRKTDPLYPPVAHIIPRLEWDLHAPTIARINDLKKEMGAVILAHNYMTPEIFHAVGDFQGDSLALARQVAKTDADLIVQAGVHFMAETSKILSPEKTVLIPSLEAGCSLASSITGADVRLLKERYPGVPVVTYVNTTADVKAETDICCTSSNAVQVVEHICAEWDTDQVILIPDQYLAKNVAAMTSKKVITWAGSCEVHEQFTAEDIREIRAGTPGVIVLAHPECPPEVLGEADFAGSTAAMSGYVQKEQPQNVVLITECSMSDNVAIENPEVNFVRPCNLCPHMKKITLEGILHCLETKTHEVLVDEDIADRARLAVQRMIDLPPLGTVSNFSARIGGDVIAVEHR
ncbi:MAG: quinolinate synthase NadA [Pseudomonadota bacterium]